MYDLVIVGGGPAGVSAGIYAERKKIKVAIIAESFGGQSIVSADIQNWIGAPSISGFDLAKNLETHLKAHSDIDIFEGDLVVSVDPQPDGTFILKTREGKSLSTRFVLLAAGSHRRTLNVSGEQELNGRGVAYCATCDAPLFSKKVVAVVGGGNSACESVVDLLPYASKIYLIIRSDVLRGDPITQDRIKNESKVSILYNSEVVKIEGIDKVTGLQLKNNKTGELSSLPLDGVFVEIGAVPNSEFVKDLVQLNQFGEIVVDHKTQSSSYPGIWAAGDISDVLYKQNNISAGDAIKAVLNIYEKIVRSS